MGTSWVGTGGQAWAFGIPLYIGIDCLPDLVTVIRIFFSFYPFSFQLMFTSIRHWPARASSGATCARWHDAWRCGGQTCLQACTLCAGGGAGGGAPVLCSSALLCALPWWAWTYWSGCCRRLRSRTCLGGPDLGWVPHD